MANRTTQSYKTGSGGLYNGSCADTIVTINDAGRKDILLIAYSFGSNGAPFDIPTSYARLCVIQGDMPGSANGSPLNVGISPASPNVNDFGGQIILDLDLVMCAPSQGVPSKMNDAILFSPHADTGRVGVESGALTIYLSALRDGSNNPVSNVVGKVFAQYRTIYTAASTRNYALER